MSAPLPVAPPYEVREVVCPLCRGEGSIEVTINLRFMQDSQESPCTCDDGKVTVHVAELDDAIHAWCPTLGILAVVDEAELASGAWDNWHRANRFDFRDRRLMGELGAGL